MVNFIFWIVGESFRKKCSPVMIDLKYGDKSHFTLKHEQKALGRIFGELYPFLGRIMGTP